MYQIRRTSKGLRSIIGSRLLAISIASAIFIGLLTTLVAITIPLTSTTPARISYTSHGVIAISDNAQFTNASGVVWGSGIVSDPYIISGWDIDATLANGIYIHGTTAYFVIRDCYIHNGGAGYQAISLTDCVNGTLDSNTCSNNFIGIYLGFSSNNTISNNNCISNNDYGIYLGFSSNNTLKNNNCSNNRIGIYLRISSNSSMVNNTCNSNTQHGIYLYSTSDNDLSNNDCSNNSHGVWLWLSSNNTISNNNCSNNVVGIRLYSSSNNTISNNNCNFNSNYGIYLESSSDNNTIVGNLLINNSSYGVTVRSGSNNNGIWDNTFIGNNGTVSVYNPSRIQANDDSTNNWWNSSHSPHGYGNYWSDWLTPDNDTNGVIDLPYNVSGSAGVNDCYPLSFVPEKTPPITTDASTGTIGANLWFRSNASVSFSTTDAGSGVNVTFYLVDTSGGWRRYISSFIISSDGNHTVQFYSMDNAGNIESVKNMSVRIDTTDPTLNIIQTAGFETAVDYAVISWTGTDATTGIDHFEVGIDGGSFVSVGTVMSYNFSGLADGTHNVTVKAIDAAGNEVNKTIQFIVDTIPKNIPNGGTAGDLLLYGAIGAIITLVIIVAIVIMMRIKKMRPMKPDELEAEPPVPPAV